MAHEADHPDVSLMLLVILKGRQLDVSAVGTQHPSLSAYTNNNNRQLGVLVWFLEASS